MATLPELSRAVSLVDAVKFAKQGVMFGNPDLYELPTRSEQQWLLTYMPRDAKDETGLASSMVTPNGQKARITVQMADLGTPEMRALTAKINDMVERVFPGARYDVVVTGASIKFIRSTTYLINNLILSLSLAVVAISIIMALLFMSWRMVLVSLIPNLIPMLFTAELWDTSAFRWPSTILVFSIAFGISVDDSLHFLAKYKQELKANNWNIKMGCEELYCGDRSEYVLYVYRAILWLLSIYDLRVWRNTGTRSLNLNYPARRYDEQPHSLAFFPTYHGQMVGKK